MCMYTGSSFAILTMTCVAVYAYYQPYQTQYINVVEIVILVDQLLLLMMAPTSQFKVTHMIMTTCWYGILTGCGVWCWSLLQYWPVWTCGHYQYTCCYTNTILLFTCDDIVWADCCEDHLQDSRIIFHQVSCLIQLHYCISHTSHVVG